MNNIPAFTIQFIGLTISFVQLGVAAAQGFCYYQAFPDDKRLLKILNTTGALLSSFMYWSFFTNCFKSMSPECQAWDAMMQLFVNITVPFIVQSFYCHRVWISKLLSISCMSLIMQLCTHAVGAFSSITPLKMSTTKAFQSVLCDSLISFSVYFYLRAGRFGVHRTDTRIKTITKNFISMGVLVSLLSISICISYWANASVAIGGIVMVLRALPGLQTMGNDIELATISAVHNSR
ncbi:hypothetical protein BDR07DRAFT_1435033 [Suillus spraguei]|nr:hypothetical protein BDR07DRAFT_1435033 [Suillus spraguei]